MSKTARGFLRLLNKGVALSPELNQKIAAFENMANERSAMENELNLLRQKQEEIEDDVAEALAEDEFQCIMRGQPFAWPTDDEMDDIFKGHLSSVIDKLTGMYEQALSLGAEIRKLKLNIENGIAAANEEPQ
ncbi:hypothetical protein KR009_006876 [Drosophila setifemur]|nr:hypothetical protein KR009_006876 [Drosophila setifemur]